MEVPGGPGGDGLREGIEGAWWMVGAWWLVSANHSRGQFDIGTHILCWDRAAQKKFGEYFGWENFLGPTLKSKFKLDIEAEIRPQT